MTRSDKLFAKLRARPVRARYTDVRKVLEDHGWFIRSQEGSHVTFKKPGVGLPSFTIAVETADR